MAYDIFCAVCGGPTFRVPIAQRSRKALLRRNREGAVSRDAEDLATSVEDRNFQGYDPEVVRVEDVAWTGGSHALGFNPDATAIEKTYISGIARYIDYGCMQEILRGDDPNSPGSSAEIQCYRVYDATQTPCFPVHPPCLSLLAKALTSDEDAKSLDKDTLYQIIADLSDWYSLKLDFGEPSVERSDSWQIHSGEEMLVVHPGRKHDFTILLRNTVSTDDFELPAPVAPPPDIESRIRADIFARLPYDIIHQVMLLLPSHSVLALCNASYFVHSAFRSPNRSFWRAALHACMPWFWEIHTLMRHGTVDDETTDYKGLFMWLEKNTKPRFGLEGPFMGISNRRRIWSVCEQYAALYAPRVAAKRRERMVSKEAEEVWEDAKNLGLPAVAQPLPREGIRTSTVQWVSDLVRDPYGGALLEAVWDANQSLVGLAMTLNGSQRRLFGKDKGPGWTREKTEIDKGCWIKGLVLHMPDMFLTEEIETSIKGITVLTTDQEGKKLLGNTSPAYCQRLLSIWDQHVLVGVVGHISSNDKICRLGLVQHHNPDIIQSFHSYTPTTPANPANPAAAAAAERSPLLHQPLYKPPNASTKNALHRPDAPIWSNHPRTVVALPSTERVRARYHIQAAWHDDLVPVDALVWAASARERRALRRLTAHLFEGRHVCCVRAEYTAESGIQPREIGNEAVRQMLALDRERPRKEAPMWWREWAAGMTVEALDVDGPGGEVVVGVEVLHDEDIRTISLRTNWQRYVHWGQDRDCGNLDGTEARRGYVIIGLALGFSFSDHIVHRWEDGSGMVLREDVRMSWLATLTVDQAWFA